MQQSVWWQWHRHMTYYELQPWRNQCWRSENRPGVVCLTTEEALFWLTFNVHHKSLHMFRCTDLFWIHVQISNLFASLSYIRRSSRSTHGVWLDNPVLLLLCQRGWSFILAPLCLSVCWYICLPVLQDWLSGGGSSVYCSSVTHNPVFYFILCHWRWQRTPHVLHGLNAALGNYSGVDVCWTRPKIVLMAWMDSKWPSLSEDLVWNHDYFCVTVY